MTIDYDPVPDYRWRHDRAAEHGPNRSGFEGNHQSGAIVAYDSPDGWLYHLCSLGRRQIRGESVRPMVVPAIGRQRLCGGVQRKERVTACAAWRKEVGSGRLLSVASSPCR